MKFHLDKNESNWYWQETNNPANKRLINLANLEDLIKAVKKMLYEIAWNDDMQRELYLELLEAFSVPIASNVLSAARTSRIQLEKFLMNYEILNGARATEDDFSDDSDDEASDASVVSPGADLANQNQAIKNLKHKFLANLRNISNNMVVKHLINNEAEIFRDAIAQRYAEHIERIGLSGDASITEINFQSGIYKISCSSLSAYNYEIETYKVPHVTLFRGIGYFADRWNGQSRAIHREELSEQPLYSESLILRNSGFWYNYPGFASINQEQLGNDAERLLDNLVRLKKGQPLVLINGASKRFYADLLELLQYIYTNGVDRYLRLIDRLPDEFLELKDALPREGNIMLSTSELPYHAIRYARGIKEPYSDFGLPPRYDTNAKPEKPYSGKLYVTTHPVDDFLGEKKPNIIRELHKLGAVTTTKNIGPEMEVSFLGYLPKERFVHAEKIKLPNFSYQNYPKHYLDKYGITEEIYDLVKTILKTYTKEYFEWYEIKFAESLSDPVEAQDISFFMYDGKLCVRTVRGSFYVDSNFKLYKKIADKLNKTLNIEISEKHKKEIVLFATGQDGNLKYEIKLTANPVAANGDIQLFMDEDNIICRVKGFKDRIINSGKKQGGIAPDSYKYLRPKIEKISEEVELSLTDKEDIVEYTTSIGLTQMHRHLLQRDLADYIAMYNAIRLMLWQIKDAEDKNKVLLFLNEQGQFSTKIPIWQNTEVRSKELNKYESDLADYLAGSCSLRTVFSANRGEIYSTKMQISPVSYEDLSPKYQSVLLERKRSSHSGEKEVDSSYFSPYSMLGLEQVFGRVSLSDVQTPVSSSSRKAISAIEAERKKELIENSMKFKQRGIDVEDVDGDGNCFFHAISKQFEKFNAEKIISYSELRGFATIYMREHRENFREFLSEDIDSYINRMARDGTWADNHVIQALANDFNINIEIYHIDGNIISVRGNNGSAENIVRIAYTGDHYFSVTGIPQLTFSLEDTSVPTLVKPELDENTERLVEDGLASLDNSRVEDSTVDGVGIASFTVSVDKKALDQEEELNEQIAKLGLEEASSSQQEEVLQSQISDQIISKVDDSVPVVQPSGVPTATPSAVPSSAPSFIPTSYPTIVSLSEDSFARNLEIDLIDRGSTYLFFDIFASW